MAVIITFFGISSHMDVAQVAEQKGVIYVQIYKRSMEKPR